MAEEQLNHVPEQIDADRDPWFAKAVLLLVVVVGPLWWATSSPAVPLLTPRGAARWIVPPLQPVYRPRVAVAMPTQFRKDLVIHDAVIDARIQVRAMRQFRLTVNGQPLGRSDDAQTWKRTFQFDASSHLKIGDNRIVVQVANDRGPSALWLTVDVAAKPMLVSDATWQASLAGSNWVGVREAAAFTSNRDLEYPPPWTLDDVPPVAILIVFIMAAAIVWMVGRQSVSLRMVVITTVVLWTALFLNSAGVLHQRMGYDAAPHLAYIQHLLDNHALPHIDQGFETNQPPLYYIIAAASLKLCGLQTTDPGAAYVLRMLGLLGGIAQVLLIFALMRLVFRDDRRRALVGWCVAAALPVHLYLFQYVTNEWLIAVLSTASLVVAVRMIVRDDPSRRSSATLGVLLGASLLTKMTALLPVGVIVLMLVGRHWRRTVLPLVIALAVGGWHYVRTWSQTGSPFVTTNHPASGLQWWQDPGYTTPGYFANLSTIFTEPFYCGFRSFPGALYTTLFGDGMLGSRAANIAPAWNYSLMMLCYLLSILVAVAFAIGLIACARQVVRKWDPIHAGMLAMPLLMLLAMVMFTLRIANFPGTRAIYGVAVAAPCCVLAAWGLDLMMRKARAVVSILLVAWALTAFAAFWIHRSSPQAMVNLAVGRLEARQVDDALALLNDAVEIDPANKQARLGLITILSQIDRKDEAREHADQLLATWSDDPEVLWACARLLEPGPALVMLDRALAISPHHAKALLHKADLLAARGDVDAAITTYRRTLPRDPDDMHTHRALARLYRQDNQTRPARFHAEFAELIREKAALFPQSH